MSDWLQRERKTIRIKSQRQNKKDKIKSCNLIKEIIWIIKKWLREGRGEKSQQTRNPEPWIKDCN